MFQKTITFLDLKHCDILFYRPQSWFGYLIGFFTAVMNGKFDRVTFTHTAGMIRDPGRGIRRFDAMEGKKTGFRKVIGKAYVFRFKDTTPLQKNLIQEYCLSREGSEYDRRGIASFLVSFIRFFGSKKKKQKLIAEDEFKDYCSELYKNAFVYAGLIEDVERITPHNLYKLIRAKVDFVGLIL